MRSNRVVYDSDVGRTDRCSNCKRQVDACVCPKGTPGKAAPTGDGIVRVSRDRKGRRGKTVTVILGVRGSEGTLSELATTLKQLCGSGGTVVDGAIEIQGDHRDRVAATLTELGHRVKLSGG